MLSQPKQVPFCGVTSDDLSLSRHFQEAKLFCSTSKDVEFVCRPFGRPATDKLSYFALEAKAYNITVLILKGWCVMKIFRGSYLEKEITICSPLSGF